MFVRSKILLSNFVLKFVSQGSITLLESFGTGISISYIVLAFLVSNWQPRERAQQSCCDRNAMAGDRMPKVVGEYY